MAKKKGGSKKIHRRINTQDVTDFLEKETREERQGLQVHKVPDAELFFVDKAGDEEAAAVKQAAVPRKLAARSKVLRSQAILLAAHNAKPVAHVVPHKTKGSVLEQQLRVKQQQGAVAAAAAAAAGGGGRAGKARKGRSAAAAGPIFDLWEAPAEDKDGWTDSIVPAKRQRRVANPATCRPPGTAGATAAVGAEPEVRRPYVPALEIDPAGCSYNPDQGQHQEAVAAAVAAETRKLLDRELQPVAPPRTVDWQPETDELTLLTTLEGGGGGAGEDDDEDMEGRDSDGDEGAVEAARRRQESSKKTRKDRNREQRRKDTRDLMGEQRKLKAQRRDLSSLPAIQAELLEEQEEQEATRLRRNMDKAERLAVEAPKLSKHKFQAMPLQVLTSDELAGSLRRLKPTAMLAKDRFKSLQKRALIEPRRKIEQKKQGKKVEYIHGDRADRAAERQQEIQDLRKSKKKAKKQ